MKVVFVEPTKEQWFVMGEYLPLPYGIIQLAAYLEREAHARRRAHLYMATRAVMTQLKALF